MSYLNTLKMNNSFPRSKSDESVDVDQKNMSVKLFGPPSIRTFQIHAIFLVLAAVMFMATSFTLVLTDWIRINVGFSPKDAEDFGSQLKFVFRCQTPILVSIVCLTQMIVFQRLRSEAVDPLDGREDIVARTKNILTNTVEQAFMSCVAQIILVTYLKPEITLKVIPLMNIWFILGRIAFFIGYPKYRGFGFSLSFIPTSLVVLYILCKTVNLCQF